jgi:hypothetical protein
LGDKSKAFESLARGNLIDIYHLLWRRLSRLISNTEVFKFEQTFPSESLDGKHRSSCFDVGAKKGFAGELTFLHEIRF